MADYWTVQENDLVGGYIVTSYPHPHSEHDLRTNGDPSKRGYIIAECSNQSDARLIATLLNATGYEMVNLPADAIEDLDT